VEKVLFFAKGVIGTWPTGIIRMDAMLQNPELMKMAMDQMRNMSPEQVGPDMLREIQCVQHYRIFMLVSRPTFSLKGVTRGWKVLAAGELQLR
jgi:hypothetical protein